MVRRRLNVAGLDSFELFAKINPILKSWIFTFNALNNYINIWPILPRVKVQSFLSILLIIRSGLSLNQTEWTVGCSCHGHSAVLITQHCVRFWKFKWYFISVYFGKNLIRGFVPKSRYIISVSGIALILESRDSSALFLLYGDIYNKYMYINGQKSQDQKGKVTQTDMMSNFLCHIFDS